MVLLWLFECRDINQRADCSVLKWEDAGNQKGDRKSEQCQGKSGGLKGFNVCGVEGKSPVCCWSIR